MSRRTILLVGAMLSVVLLIVGGIMLLADLFSIPPPAMVNTPPGTETAQAAEPGADGGGAEAVAAETEAGAAAGADQVGGGSAAVASVTGLGSATDATRVPWTANAIAGEGPGSPFADNPTINLLALEPPPSDLVDLARRMGRTVGDVADGSSVADVGYALGDTRSFWVHDIEGQEYFEVDATLRALTDNASVWVQQDLEVDQNALDRGASTFSDEVMPILREVYGSEDRPGIDGDDRVHVLHAEGLPGVAGYFSATDLLPVAVEPHSNQHEMFYVNHASYRPGSGPYLSLLAHEFQHMIHNYQDSDEPVWTNEGLSELAAVIAGYGNQNGGAFFGAPDTGLTQWSVAVSSNSTHYAASFAFFAYLHARYGDAVLREVVAASSNGPAGIEAALRAVGEPRDFDALFLDWVVANLVHDNGRSDDTYSYGEIDVSRVTPRELDVVGAFDSVHQYGTDYFDVTGLVDNGAVTIRFDGAPDIGLLSSVPEDDGQLWWSNAGDGVNSRLTRTFDLTDVDDASLDFRMWHALEPNWDYGYVSVSVDGGQTWEPLALQTSSEEDPNGNNLGNGLTGGSGGWVDVSIDLGPYVGAPADIRFEIVTDDAISMSGLAIDDIRVNALGFADDAELDEGWLAEGWLRIDPLLLQRWGVQLIVDSGGGVTVHPIIVDDDGQESVEIADIPDDATVTLTVSAMTPATRNPGTYSVTFGPKVDA